MSTQALLPPHVPGTDAESSKGFDIDAFATDLGNQPKEYSDVKQPEPPPAPEPEPIRPEPESEPGPKPTGEDGASAEFIIDMYDGVVSKVCSAMVDDEKYPSEHFAMEEMLKEQAKTQLAKGMASGGGKWNIPWWVALSVVMIFHGFMTWQAVRAARREKEERKAEERTQRQQAAHNADPNRRPTREVPVVVHPSSITDASGATVKVKPTKELKVYGICTVCQGPVHRKNRTVCSQSCSGKATSAKRRAAKSPAPTVPETVA